MPSLGSTRSLDDNRCEHLSTTTCLNRLVLLLYKYYKQSRSGIFSQLLGSCIYKNASGNIHAIVEMIFYFPYGSNVCSITSKYNLFL